MLFRLAMVIGVTPETVQAYLPSNYEVIYDAFGLHDLSDRRGYPTVLILGQDRNGFTLDDYVIPRLASGLYTCVELTPTRDI